MIGKKFRAHVTEDGTICAGNSTFALAISVEATLLLEKVSTYGLLPRLWLLIPINKEHKSILGGGGAAAGRPVSISSDFWRFSSNLEQLLLFWAIFDQNHDRLRAHIKREKVNDFTENFVGVNQPESKVQKGKNVDNNK